jgi:hypothetical protein
VVRIGQLIEVDEDQYRYGRGPLRLRVTGIGDRFSDPAGSWIRLRGWKLYYEDKIDERGGEDVYDVRVDALPPPSIDGS